MGKREKIIAGLKSTKSKANNLVESYNSKEAKSNAGVSAMKSGVDLVLGVGLGGLIGKMAGKYSPFAGTALIFIGHYTGDKTGLLKIIGASSIAYGIAKALDDDKESTITEKLKEYGQEGLKAFFFIEPKNKENDTAQKNALTPSSDTPTEAEINGVDLSILDFYDDMNHEQAEKFLAEQNPEDRPLLSGAEDFEELETSQDEQLYSQAMYGTSSESSFGLFDNDDDEIDSSSL